MTECGECSKKRGLPTVDPDVDTWMELRQFSHVRDLHKDVERLEGERDSYKRLWGNEQAKRIETEDILYALYRAVVYNWPKGGTEFLADFDKKHRRSP